MAFDDKSHIADLIQSAKNIAILCNNGTSDSVAAGIALGEYIEDSFSKVPTVIYPFDLETLNINLLEIRNLFTDFEPKVLKVRLNFNGTDIETVDYHKENNDLILEIRPVGRNFDMDRIKFDLDGIEYDLIITLGAKNLHSFGEFYSKNKEEIKNANIINIDNSRNNDNFGKINIINPDAEKISSLILSKFAEWGYTPSKDAAKSLLIGISEN